MEEYIRRSDPRIRRARGRGDWVLFQTMQDIKRITGHYHDELLAEFVSHVSPNTPTALRRWRGREAALWKRVMSDQEKKAASIRKLTLSGSPPVRA